jgi:hypothetical protein
MFSFDTYEAAGICCRDAVNNRSPDIEILTSTAVAVRATGIAQLCTSVNVIPIDEGETHVLDF